MDAPTPSSPRDQLAALRLPLLDLHKRLLDAERRMYELAHGRVSAGELLNLALQDPQFAWLHPISELIVRIDELIALDDLPDQQDVAFIAERIRALLVPSASGSAAEQRYDRAIQNDPAVLLAHRAVMQALPR
ncbi:MAG: hypothetical protein AB7P99_16910 [Vicinamibacterales bacterium]